MSKVGEEEMRLIDADKVKEHIRLYFNKFARDGLKTELIELAISNISKVVDNVPTNVDAEPIIRCKDCYYAKPFNEIWVYPIKDTLVCTYFTGDEEVDDNYFCGCAIKKMDENEKFDDGFFCGCAIKKLDMKGEEDE